MRRGVSHRSTRVAEQKINGFARIVTLGCRLNAADSALLYTALGECGFIPSETDPPDVLIVNKINDTFSKHSVTSLVSFFGKNVYLCNLNI